MSLSAEEIKNISEGIKKFKATVKSCEDNAKHTARTLIDFENRIKTLEEQQRQQKMAIEALHKGFKEIVGIKEESEEK